MEKKNKKLYKSNDIHFLCTSIQSPLQLLISFLYNPFNKIWITPLEWLVWLKGKRWYVLNFHPKSALQVWLHCSLLKTKENLNNSWSFQGQDFTSIWLPSLLSLKQFIAFSNSLVCQGSSPKFLYVDVPHYFFFWHMSTFDIQILFVLIISLLAF